MSKCDCMNCEYLGSYKKVGNVRTTYRCRHSDQSYILRYFLEHGIFYAPGFLGFGKEGFPRKTTPKWCPLRKERAEHE